MPETVVALMPYAEGTKVEVSKSQADIERLVKKKGGDQFMSGWTQEFAQVAFSMNGRMLRFRIPLQSDKGGFEREHRRRWRALLLVIKSKFEIVDSEIQTFEEAFLSDIVMHDGKTMGEWALPQVQLMYERGEMPKLLEGPTS